MDCYHAVKVMGQDCAYVWHHETDLTGYDCIILPGGFSYGDYLRTGAIARFSPVMEAVAAYAQQGKPVIGICNGFQILLEAGLLPGAMMRNEKLQFVCQYTNLRLDNATTPFTRRGRPGGIYRVPVAHGDGNYYADKETLDELEKHHQVVFRYATPEGRITPESNPNGSVGNIAGICNRQRNVLGMMPHPERCTEALLGSADGRLIWESLLGDAGQG
jgi:phosphoribosylformylglycinamidine synthase